MTEKNGTLKIFGAAIGTIVTLGIFNFALWTSVISEIQTLRRDNRNLLERVTAVEVRVENIEDRNDG